MRYKNIVWDWNGTLLNDVQVGVDTLNDMLGKRGLPLLSLEGYKDVFGFPVVDFYKKVGFDMEKESLHEISVDFVETYDRFAGNVTLNKAVPEVLCQIKQSGRKQYILSALKENLLKQMVLDFHIGDCFEQVCGSDNIYAAGKIERGKRMVEDYGLRPEETLMVGDTLHDAEVAQALGFGCVLYAGGHNSLPRLREKAPVIAGMEELLEKEMV
ncbi:HAD family hydrolase [Odoribacter lunatus]|uniref:HAD family hydrolase n=1 Tax=Odoribacter lunatus TaxID=2941335 RepID=UPI00203E94DD|nr:HAD family hydrolase [Odoribacter lunatus]